MKINGNDVENFLNSLSGASLLKRDNNDYLISYRLKSGKDIAFDPRTKNKASVFVGKLPENLDTITDVGNIVKYPPKKSNISFKARFNTI